MISSILDTSTKMTHKTNNSNNEEGMVLLWSRHDDYNYEYEHDFKSQTNNDNSKEITWISIESKTIDKKFFSGRNLENVITNLQNDSLALTCWISKDLTRILISKKTILSVQAWSENE